MARTNFSYEKRQRELAKQKKAEEKRLRKLERRNLPESESEEVRDDAADAGADTSTEDRPGE